MEGIQENYFIKFYNFRDDCFIENVARFLYRIVKFITVNYISNGASKLTTVNNNKKHRYSCHVLRLEI